MWVNTKAVAYAALVAARIAVELNAFLSTFEQVITMRLRHSIIGLCILSIMLILANIRSALATGLLQGDGESSKLAIVGIVAAPEKPNAGDEIAFRVTVANQGTLAVTDTATVTLETRIYDGAAGQVEIGAPCKENAPEVIGLVAGGKITHDFVCRPRIATQGTYSIAVTLSAQDAAGQPIGGAGPISPLTRSITVQPYTTALPDQLARLFAGLGIFAAIMMIMALGTEAAIDSLKLMIGLKSKVSASDALNDMEKYLPGQLAALGAGAAAQGQVQHLIKDMQKTLRPLDDLSSVKAAIDQGDFADAFKKMQVLIPKSGVQFANEELDKLKASARLTLDGLQQVGKRLNLPQSFVDQHIEGLTVEISKFQAESVSTVVQSVLERLRGFGLQAVGEWLKQVQNKSHAEILRLFDDNLSIELQRMGIQTEDISQLRLRLIATLDVIDTKALTVTDTYLAAVNNLLQAVEDRRNDMQSPSRKLWRRLRDSKYADVVIGIAVAILAFILSQISWHSDDSFDLSRLLSFLPALRAGVLVGVVVAIVTVVLFRILGKISVHYHKEIFPDSENAPTLQKVEVLFNAFRGQEDLNPSNFGKPRNFEQVYSVGSLSVDNIAQTVLKMTDKHRDEEDSRLRSLRVVSVVMGFVLAYLLQIDAARLLDTAIPQVSGTLNFFQLGGGQLHHFWTVFSDKLQLTPGIILTGLAASAGSTFWHDQLDRLQATKKASEGAANLLKQAQNVISGGA